MPHIVKKAFVSAYDVKDKIVGNMKFGVFWRDNIDNKSIGSDENFKEAVFADILHTESGRPRDHTTIFALYMKPEGHALFKGQAKGLLPQHSTL